MCHSAASGQTLRLLANRIKPSLIFRNFMRLKKIARNAQYSPEQRYTLRLERSKPILDDMKIWMEKSLRHAVPQSKLEVALNYMNQCWQQLINFLLDGSLEIDNNGIENQIDYLRHLFENICLCKTHDDYIQLLPFNLNLNLR